MQDSALYSATVRHALLGFLQLVAVLLVGVLVYGLTFLLTTSGPWPYRAAAGVAASATAYVGAIRSRPRPWLRAPEEPSPPGSPDAPDAR